MTEDKIEQNALKILADMGWQVLFGPDIGPDGSSTRRNPSRSERANPRRPYRILQDGYVGDGADMAGAVKNMIPALYLDIDGVLLANEENLAIGAAEFIKY